MGNDKKYIVVENTDREDFEIRVGYAIDKGYKLQGGVHTDIKEGEVRYYQALIK